jgi:hypothetical protein
MNEITDRLNLNPRSQAELHRAVEGFEQKWFMKARRVSEVELD